MWLAAFASCSSVAGISAAVLGQPAVCTCIAAICLSTVCSRAVQPCNYASVRTLCLQATRSGGCWAGWSLREPPSNARRPCCAACAPCRCPGRQAASPTRWQGRSWSRCAPMATERWSVGPCSGNEGTCFVGADAVPAPYPHALLTAMPVATAVSAAQRVPPCLGLPADTLLLPLSPPHHPARQVAPYLRGEWDTSKVGLLAPPEQRIQLAVDALLGAVPIWFKVSIHGSAATPAAVHVLGLHSAGGGRPAARGPCPSHCAGWVGLAASGACCHAGCNVCTCTAAQLPALQLSPSVPPLLCPHRIRRCWPSIWPSTRRCR